MRKPSRGLAVSWTWLLPLVPLLTLSSCLLVVSTQPTTVSGATIVFVAIDDRGALVASLHITVKDIDGDWRQDGLTTRDGSFRCDVRPDIGRVRAEVEPPTGYVLVRSSQWPRELDVRAGDSIRVEIRVTAQAS
jgi:hypothetical protein